MLAQQYRAIDVKDMPAADQMLPGVTYIEADGDGSAFAVGLLCPCGCGEGLEVVIRSPNRDGDQTWLLTRHQGTISLEPSLYLKTGCRAHFYLTQGRIHWVGDPPPIRR